MTMNGGEMTVSTSDKTTGEKKFVHAIQLDGLPFLVPNKMKRLIDVLT